jgi:hypothetical protein
VRRAIVVGLSLAPALCLASGPAEAAMRQPSPSTQCTAVARSFGRMFPSLPAARWPAADVDALAQRVMAPEEDDPTPEGQVDPEENADIDAGYTYIGQFIDHDLTLDNRPDDLTTPVDPTTLVNGRTPAFDLDSIYGGGPDASPQLYAPDHVHLLLGAPLSGADGDPGAVDLPRDANGQALAGDGRDDENRIVASLHTIMLRFHNRWVDRLTAQHPEWPPARVLAEAQRAVRWHYQWAVLTDFLPTMVGRPALSAVFGGDPRRPRLTFYKPCAQATPVEFSVAAYRFGHSMVRPIYRLNAAMPARLPVFSLVPDGSGDIGGFRPSPPNLAVDWRFFLQMGRTRSPGVPQSSYRIDNSLVFPLSLLPGPARGAGPASLAVRNLLRGEQVGLPSGQSVARAMGIRPLRDDQILVGEATGDPGDAVPITAVSPAFAGKAPLWTYVLAEATASAFPVARGRIVGRQVAPFRLGPVGGRIVAETFAGMLQADRTSVLWAPGFRPDPSIAPGGRFGFRELIQAATSAPAAAPAPPVQGRDGRREGRRRR